MVLIVWTPAERAFVVVEYVVIVGGHDPILDEGVLGDARELVEYGVEEHGGGRTQIFCRSICLAGAGRLKRKWRFIRFYDRLRMGLIVGDEEAS